MTNKETILMVAACPFPANYGSPASIREMSDTLAEFGHEVHIVTYSYGDDLPVHHAHVHRVPHLGSRQVTVGPTWQKPLLDFMLVWLACWITFKHKCRIIHAHNYEGALVGICCTILTGRPLLYNAVNFMSDELAGYNFIRPRWVATFLAHALDWFVPKIPDRITTVSPELKATLIRHGVPAAKIDVIPAGVLPEFFTHADPLRFRTQLNLGNAQVVLYTGTLDTFQGVDSLLEAFARLGPDLSDARLVIVCPFVSPAQKSKLDALADQLKIRQRLVLVESHPLADLPDYLALADVAVVPRPRCPGHPVKLLNYMCAARPIVTMEGSAKGIRHLENGYVSADDDIEGMSQGIALLLRDRSLASRLGQAAFQTLLAEYDWRSICRKIEIIYQQMLEKK